MDIGDRKGRWGEEGRFGGGVLVVGGTKEEGDIYQIVSVDAS